MNAQILQNYQQRLTNLSSRNRSLKLLKPVKNKDLDFFSFAFEETQGHHDLLNLLINFKKIPLIRKLNPHDEKTSTLDKQLNAIYRTVLSIESETGVYPLKVGYPFIQGKFLNDTIARCPLIVFPYRLIKNNQNQNRWYLEPIKDEEPHWNTVFFLALQQFHQIKFPDEFWEIEFPNFDNIQIFWNWLYEQIQQFDIPIKWNTDVFQEPYKIFSEYQSHYVKNFPLGELKIIPESLLGLFPETDTALFEDYEFLVKNTEVLSQHTAFSPLNDNHSLSEEPFIQVVDLDASQEKVILNAKNGNNLVVQGPPGTGKSQVIINFIADNIARGKKILVVSQKRAALDVVYNRLEKLGLHDFVNLVHDHQADKAIIYRKWNTLIQNFLENPLQEVTSPLEEFHKTYSEIQNQLKEQEKIYQNLWDKKPFDISASELCLKVQIPDKPWDSNFLPTHYTYQELQGFLVKLKEILIYKHLLDTQNLWFHRKSFAQSSYFEILEKLQNLPQIIQNLYEQLQSVAYKGYYLMEITNLQEIIDYYLYCDELLKNNPKFYALYQFLVSHPQSILEVKKSLKHYEEQKTTIEKFWWLKTVQKEGVDTVLKNIDTYHQLKTGFFRFLNPDWWFISKYWDKFFQNHNLSFSENSLDNLKNQIQQYLDFQNVLKEKPWLELGKIEIEFAFEFFNKMIFEDWKPQFIQGELNQEHWKKSIEYFQKLREVKNTWDLAQKSLETWLSNVQIQTIFSELYANKIPHAYLQQLLESFQKEGHDLIQLDKALEKLSFIEKTIFERALPFLKDFENPNEWIQMIENQIYWNWIQKLEKLNPNLMELASKSFEFKSERCKGLYSEFQEDSRKYVYFQWYEHLKQVLKTENKIFKEMSYQTKKKRALWSFRKMIENYWNKGLEVLAPCWLVSPEAASAIFHIKPNLFDWIIFDEASQCYVEKAIPVMFRASHALIIGDSQQLQPYNLYEIKIENLDDENQEVENEILTEVESLLSFAEHKFQNNKLLWHYRAENEALIQFSNNHFYENQLRFAPFPNHKHSFLPPLEWVKVKGIWEKNTNPEEAQKVIDILQNLIDNQIFESIGIITFNYHQQQLILDLLDQKLQSITHLPEQFNAWNRLIDNNGIEKLFVKNIENVQGDERDIIIFSVGYAYNKEGKFIQQFGALSQKGGENRLNVAVSRAKKKIFLVTSIESEDIKADLSSKGALLLKEYLKYVKNNHFDNSLFNKNSSPTPLALAISEKLNNYPEVKWYFPQDGMDLAIILPNQKSIAVFCEDGIIKRSSSIKELEIYLPKLLQNRGWEVKKVFAKNWLLDSQKVIENLIS